MKKTLRNIIIIVIAVAAILNVSSMMTGFEVHAFGDLYASKNATIWDSTAYTKNASLTQTAKLPKASAAKTTYKDIKKKTTATSAKKAKAMVKKAKKAAPVWEKTSYQWTNGKFQRITVYKTTTVKASIKNKKAKVTKIQRRMIVTETYKHFKKEYRVSDLAPLTDNRVARAYEKKGWKLYVNTNMKGATDGLHFGDDEFLTGLTTATTRNGKSIKQIDVRVPEVAYHELGHFVAIETGRSDLTAEFKTIMKKEYNKNGNPVKPHAGLNAEEYFADAFAAYCESPSALKAKAPGTYAYIVKQINAL